jgi:BMFP domain-containing protein YqiC
VQSIAEPCAKTVHPCRHPLRPTPRDTLRAICFQDLHMLAPKDLLDALSGHASRLFSGDTPLPRTEIESQFKALLQSGFSKLDLVSREEFDSQMVVLARTRARLESLEAKVAELEARLNPPAE